MHAEFFFDPNANSVTVRDLGSTNGTFVNRERLGTPHILRPDDQVRIGQHLISVAYRDTDQVKHGTDTLPGTQPLTRDLLLESVDQHAVLLYEVSERLNTIIDLDTALREVASLMKVAMGADKCEVVLSERFGQLADLGFPTTIAKLALDKRSAVVIPDVQADAALGKSALLLRVRSALCVPVMSGDDIVALLYVYKSRPLSRPFDHRDLQLAVAISHQAALTIQRTRLLTRIKREQRVRQLLQRFLSPPEAEYLLQDYLKTGHLPEMAEQTLTVLFADMRDSTGLAERVGARRFGELLGRYYQDMTKVVFDHGGLLNKYLGDGLMAVFGATQIKTEPEARAVKTALAMMAQLDAMNRAEGEQIEIGVGLNTGPAMAGYLGTEERVEFTVLGDTVNVAQRLEVHARPNRIFIGPRTCEAIMDHFNVQLVGPIEVKGRSQPIEVFEVLRE
jgi:adenylate cyclase